MKKLSYIFFSLLSLSSFFVKSQIVLNNGGIININGGTVAANKVFVVLNSPPATPISMTNIVAAQGIMMETEFSKLKYNLGTAITSINVPYLSWNLEYFPLSMYSITAGIGATGAICFSSKPAGKTAGARSAGWDNLSYEPTQVSNMNNASGTDNSANVIDRFWIIEPIYYTAAPAVTIDFTYINAEANPNGSGNTANLNLTLAAQRYDTTAGQTWDNYGPMGTNTTGGSTGTVTGVVVPSNEFFPDWTLANYLIPLPVQLLDYKGVCNNSHVNLKWTTVSETNSAFFTIEKSNDAVYFNVLGKVTAAGNSTSNINYSFTDNSTGTENTVYYRLSETDKNGKTEIFKTITVENCVGNFNSDNGTIFSPDNQNVVVNLNSSSTQNINVNAYDIAGRLIFQNQEYAVEGNNVFKIQTTLASGIYLFEIKTNTGSIVKKITIDNKN